MASRAAAIRISSPAVRSGDQQTQRTFSGDRMSIGDIVNPLYSLSGFGVGLLVGLTGVGGGSLMTPALILLFGIHPATAVGTDLLYAAITKTGGALVHGRNKSVDWRLTARLTAGSVPAAIVT